MSVTSRVSWEERESQVYVPAGLRKRCLFSSRLRIVVSRSLLHSLCKADATVFSTFMQIRGRRQSHQSDRCQLFSYFGYLAISRGDSLNYANKEADGASNKNDRLGAGDLKTTSTTHISARQHIVDSNHIVPRLLKLRSIHFVCAAWRLRLLRPL